MKRMNLIRAALFAVFAFMGTVSLSAQNWLPAPAAIPVIQNELQLLNQVPVPSPGTLMTSSQQVSDQYAKSGCPDCTLKSIKVRMLEMSAEQIKQGVDTGTAVQDVRAQMIVGAANNAVLLTNISASYNYMQSILQ